MEQTINLNLPFLKLLDRVSLSVVSDSVQTHGLQPARLLCPWDSPGRNTGVGCHFHLHFVFAVGQLLSHIQLFAIPWTAACQASLSFTISRSLPKLTSFESVMAFSHPVLCHPLLLPSIFPSIRVFSSELALCMRWLKYQSFSFSISPSKESSGLISFRVDLFDLLAVQETLKRLLQHHSSKASILQLSVFFMVQLSPPYMTNGETIALTRQTFVGKVMSPL